MAHEHPEHAPGAAAAEEDPADGVHEAPATAARGVDRPRRAVDDKAQRLDTVRDGTLLVELQPVSANTALTSSRAATTRLRPMPMASALST